ncbi:MAG: hypothetical protein BroJett003_19170 [Planctomycetota bacterium]|nr:MAG: hypothetical protein BroJett003_19170 [Planctomycetota bacterium]
MREPFQSPAPLIYVQGHLQGGPRRFAAIAVAYVAIAGFAMAVARRLTSSRLTWADIADGALKTVAISQGFILILVGSNMIYRALFRDFQSRMIESHRLSPMSNTSVVTGYLFGGPLQALLLFGLNVLLGYALGLIAQAPANSWFGGNALLLTGAVMIWSLTIFWGVGVGKPVSPVGPLIGLGFSAQLLFVFVPGMALLFGVYGSSLAVWVMLGQGSPGPAAIALVAATNLVFALFWLNAACARYRRPDLPAINALRGTVLLLMWLAASTVGIRAYQQVAQTRAFANVLPDVPEALIHWLVSLGASMLLAFIPLRNAVILRNIARQGTRLRDWSDRFPPLALLVILDPVLICGVSALLGVDVWRPMIDEYTWSLPETTFNQAALRAWSATFLACLFACVTMTALSILERRRRSPALWMTILILMLIWMFPPAFDAGRAALQRTSGTWLAGASPFGTIKIAWSASDRTTLIPGLIAQGAVAALLLLLSGLGNRTAEQATTQGAAAGV